jgi:nucleoside-diphosphate-sugar epimerase
MKILVTGANGYLGTGIVNQLLKDGNEVLATDVRTDRINKQAIIYQENLFSIEDPYHYFGEPDVLVHLAWQDGFIHNAESHIRNLSDHALFLKKFFLSSIDKIAVMGSMHEVGFYEGCIDETTSTHPMSYYGIAKDSLRNFSAFMAKETNKKFQWLRAYYIVSNQPGGSSIFSKILEKAKNKEQDFPFTMGKNQYDFLDYEEFCFQVAATVEQDEVTGIINICSGYPVKLKERVEAFISENHLDIHLVYGAYPDRKYDSKAVWGNNKKIQKNLQQAKNKKISKV